MKRLKILILSVLGLGLLFFAWVLIGAGLFGGLGHEKDWRVALVALPVGLGLAVAGILLFRRALRD